MDELTLSELRLQLELNEQVKFTINRKRKALLIP